MPCDRIRTGDYIAQQARKRGLDGLRKKLGGARVEAEATDYITGETPFRAVTDDGYVLAGSVDRDGNITGIRIDGWDLAERAGWCDECALEALKGTPEYRRIVREAQSGGSGVASYGRDAINVGRR